VRILVLSPGYPLDGELYGHAVAEQIAVLAEQHELQVQSLSSRPGLGSGWGRQPSGFSRGVPVFGPPPGGRAARLAGIWARHRARGFDLVWGLWLDRSGEAARLLAAALNIPWVGSVMGGELADMPSLRYGGARSPWARRRLQASLRSAAAVTVGSEWLADRAEALCPAARPWVTPFGVRADHVRAPAMPWRPGQPLKLATVTSSTPVKGAGRVFGALAQICREGVQANLTVYTLDAAGGRAQLREQAQAHGVGSFVTFSPPLAEPELATALADASVLVCGSAHESQGLAMIEAALAGLWVVGPEVGVMADLQALGVAQQTEDARPTTLAQAILQQAVLRPGQAQGVAEAYNRSACAARFDAVFRKVGRRA